MKNDEKKIEIVYVEPLDYFPKEIRKKYKLGEFAEPKEEVEKSASHESDSEPKISRIKELRTEKNLTQKELAELSGVSITSIRAFEQGWRYIGNVSAIDVYRIAKVLGTTIEDLLEVEPLQT